MALHAMLGARVRYTITIATVSTLLLLALAALLRAVVSRPARARFAGCNTLTNGSCLASCSASDTCFYHDLHGFFMHGLADEKLHGWIASPGSTGALLKHEQNLPVLLNGFAENIAPERIPVLRSRAGQKHYHLGFGLNPPRMPSSAKAPAVKTCLSAWLSKHAHTISEADLYMPNRLSWPNYVATRDTDGHVTFPVSYRNGVILDRLLPSLPPASKQARVLEIGAGWGSFPSLAKKVLGARVRYTILDLPHSALIQANYLRSVGYTKLLLYDPSLGDLNALLRHADYDFLWILPQHLLSVADDAFDLVINMDSMVEMPEDVVRHYASQMGRISPAFYHVNVDYLRWKTLQAALPTVYRLARSSMQPYLDGCVRGLAWIMAVASHDWNLPAGGTGYHEQLWQRPN